MKKTFLIIPALALLAACGGKQQTQNSGETATDTAANVTDVVDTVSTTTDTATSANADVDIKQCIAYEVLLKYTEKYDYPTKQMVEDQFDNEDKKDQLAKDPEFVEVDPGDGDGMMMSLRCYPNKNGGYYVLVIFVFGAWDYEFFNYKDGNLTKAKSLLPKPTINDFYANADKFPKDVFNILKPRATNDVYYYFYDDSHKLKASFEGFEWDEDDGYHVPAPLKKYHKEKGGSFHSITYIWDGEKFVRDPECKPYEEDLSLFGVESTDTKIDMSEIWKQLERRLDDEEGSKKLSYSTNSLDYYIDVNDGHCNRERKVQCYQIAGTKDYTVIDVYALMCETQSGIYDLSENTITQYTYKGGKLTKTELQEEFKQYSTDGYQTMFEEDDGKLEIEFLTSGGDGDKYLWNGEKFEFIGHFVG